MALTLVEKIAARHADGLAPNAVVRAGDFVSIRPRHAMTHDNTGAVIPKFKQIGATKIARAFFKHRTLRPGGSYYQRS